MPRSVPKQSNYALAGLTVRLRVVTVDNANAKPVYRLEVFTGAGRRRAWRPRTRHGSSRRPWQAGILSLPWAGRTFATAIIWLRRELQASQTVLSHHDKY